MAKRTLDELDRKIVGLLRENGRRPNVEIARILQVSEGTVRRRIDRLISDGVLRVVGLVDPEKLGLDTHALILLSVELPHIETTSRLLSAMPEVVRVAWVTGEFDIAVEAAFASADDLSSFLDARVRSLPGVLRSQTAHILRTIKGSGEWEPPAPPVPTVLVVDDDPDFVEATRMVLEKEGFCVRAASNGDQALQEMVAQPPDLVILDIMMDGILDGWNASWRIRSEPALRDIPILVVSSITSSDYLSMFPTDDDNLIDNFMSKPVAPQKLVAEVKRLLER